jgi:acyl-CoA thioesterase-1
MIFNSIPYCMRTMLKFCYLLSLLLVFSCGDTNTNKTNVSKSVKEENPAVAKSGDQEDRKTILFFGNSLTAGLGVEPEQSFPFLIQNRIDSLQLGYFVISAGISGETTASGETRIGWLMKGKVDIFILELGANDGLRGIPLSETRENLQAIMDIVKENNPDVKLVLAGMQIPPNMGPEYTKGFRDLFPDLAEKNNAYLIPFLLENVAGIPEMNQADGIHPTVEGHRILAENVWGTLRPLL